MAGIGHPPSKGGPSGPPLLVFGSELWAIRPGLPGVGSSLGPLALKLDGLRADLGIDLCAFPSRLETQ